MVMMVGTMTMGAVDASGLTRIRDIARPLGERLNQLEGVGLVVGLNGTGDGNDSLATLRPMMELLRNMGNPVDLTDVNAKNVAYVSISARIGRNGARSGDLIDLQVQSINGAKSLAGGRLISAPLRSNSTFDDNVYAMAEGLISIPDEDIPTSGIIRGGAVIESDIFYHYVSRYEDVNRGGYFTLVLDDEHANFQVARIVKMEIEAEFSPPGNLTGENALALRQVHIQDPKNIQITIPPNQMDKAPLVIARVMDLPVELPQPEAKVVINRRTKTIAITGNVEISPVIVHVNGLTIQILNPEPVPTPAQPEVKQSEWTAFDTGGNGSVKLQQLITALDQLNVPVEEKINAIYALQRADCLLARVETE